MTKAPILEVMLTREQSSYRRRVLSRVGSGVAASLIGSAMLGWGVLPLTIDGTSFAGIVRACTSASAGPCSNLNWLIFLSVPMLFGFSERLLTNLERRVFQ